MRVYLFGFASDDFLGRVIVTPDQRTVAQLADLFSVLPHDHVSGLLELVPKEYAKRLSEILGEREVTAGALMSSDFLTMSKNTKVGEALSWIRSSDHREDLRPLFAKYHFRMLPIVDSKERLLGVILYDDVMKAPSKKKAPRYASFSRPSEASCERRRLVTD